MDHSGAWRQQSYPRVERDMEAKMSGEDEIFVVV